jgi:FkbM family methyltransferase
MPVGGIAAKAARRLLPEKWVQRLRNGAAATDKHRVDAADFFEIAYGRRPDAAESARLDALVPDGSIRGSGQAHRVLMAFDAQSHPTAFAVRATTSSLACIELGNFKLWLDSDDPSVSAVIADGREWEPHVSGALTEFLEPGDTFVDVGANVGYHTFLAASLVGPHGRVLAIEANPENCRLLELSKLDNDASQVTILPVALDRTQGLRYLTSHIGTNAGFLPEHRDHLLNGQGFAVFATTLDDIAPGKVEAIKVDVEGAEFSVLEGGRATIARDKPLIIMEFSCEMSARVAGVDPGEALDNVLDLGYELYVLDRTSGQRIRFSSTQDLLAGWGDRFRIEDLLLHPT